MGYGISLARYHRDESAYRPVLKLNDDGDEILGELVVFDSQHEQHSRMIQDAEGEERQTTDKLISTIRPPLKARVWPQSSDVKDPQEGKRPVRVKRLVFPGGEVFFETWLG